jgi:uncharacterized protein
MYIKRVIEEKLSFLRNQYACLVIYGPRQVGKSTLIRHVFQDFNFVTLDDVDDLMLARNNPKLFLDTYPSPLIIDEIQKASNLLSELKKRIDEKKNEWMEEGNSHQLLYVLTGSNQFELQNGISESLAGRVVVLELNSFSITEKNGWNAKPFSPLISELQEKERNMQSHYLSKDVLFEEIFRGGMPELFTQKLLRDDYFKSYINTYLEKDIRLLVSESSVITFRNFLSYVALRTAQELHYDEIASSVGIDVKTTKRWISILQMTGVIQILYPFMANQSNRIIKAPKLYFMDTGLCAYLCGWPNAEMLSKCAMAGAFFETYVTSEIIKNFQAYNLDYRNELFYYRDIDGKEIDLLYVKDQRIYPIEIKKGVNPVKPTKNFDVLRKYNLPIEKGLVIDCTDRIRPINDKAYMIPVGLIG